MIGEEKGAHASKAQQGIHPALPIGRGGLSLLRESREMRHGDLERQTPSLRTPSCLPSSPSATRGAGRPVVRSIPVGSWGQPSLPTSCASLAGSLPGGAEKQKRPRLPLHSAQRRLNILVLPTLPLTKPKHSPTLATTKKIHVSQPNPALMVWRSWQGLGVFSTKLSQQRKRYFSLALRCCG